MVIDFLKSNFLLIKIPGKEIESKKKIPTWGNSALVEINAKVFGNPAKNEKKEKKLQNFLYLDYSFDPLYDHNLILNPNLDSKKF